MGQSDSDSDDAAGRKWGKSRLAIVTSIYLVMSVLLCLGFYSIEEYSPVTALYVVVQIVTTIGYGDITPATSAMRLFLSCYTVLTLVVLAYALNFVVKVANDREEAVLEQLLDSGGNLSKAHLAQRAGRLTTERRKFFISTVLFLAAVLFGTVFYAIYEDCSCSYGKTAIDHCNATDFRTCVRTKGAQKSWIDAFYFSVITLTTVGFGDFTPESRFGRWIGIVWMVLGVAATANWIGALSSLIFEQDVEQNLKQQPTGDDLFEALDQDRDGFLSRAEHHLYLLYKQGIVPHSMLGSLDEHFDALDSSRSGKISSEQMHQREFS